MVFPHRHPVSGVTALAHVDVAEGSNLSPVVDRMRQLHSRIAQNGQSCQKVLENLIIILLCTKCHMNHGGMD